MRLVTRVIASGVAEGNVGPPPSTAALEISASVRAGRVVGDSSTTETDPRALSDGVLVVRASLLPQALHSARQAMLSRRPRDRVRLWVIVPIACATPGQVAKARRAFAR